MLERILVPLDGSELAERALTFATALATPTAARLILVRAVSVRTFPGVDAREPQVHALAEAETYIQDVAARLTERGFSVEMATPFGESPALWIVSEAEMRHADLVVMSTHSRAGPVRWLFGSVAQAVVALSPVPVLIQRAWDEAQRGLLLADGPCFLVPLDSSTFAEAALPVAARFAEDFGAKLILVAVDGRPHDVKNAQEDVAAYFEPGETSPWHDVQQYLHEVSERIASQWPHLSVTARVESGEAAAGIATATAATHAAIVIMATHGRTGLARATLGSVAGRVLERGTAPLLLVRPASVGRRRTRQGRPHI